MKKLPLIILVLLLVLVIVAGHYFLTKNSVQPSTTSASATTTSASVGTSDFPQLVGSWVSTDDSNAIITFSSSGTWNDVYKEDSVKTTGGGTWTITKMPDGSMQLTEVDTFYKSVMKYSVNYVNATSLELTYLARGNTLHFKRLATTGTGS